jgi:hypothetical protein
MSVVFGKKEEKRFLMADADRNINNNSNSSNLKE